ncbi:MAG: D-tyrosyl-tRNA(Tyr) deacylase [Clostridiales bacterium]|nr:D-tyrosyl-tRNA(Tyr) deacylase [Clostridiales bacterium]
MKAVVQRVLGADLKVDGKLISEINKGYVVFLGVKVGDSEKEAEKIASKIAKLRIFEDENEKMNLSIKDAGGEILLVSQFTLYGDCKGCNRPSFIQAERPERANELYLRVKALLEKENIFVKTGVFGADMKINVQNDGPVTIILDTAEI